jgi:hypothetical protein
MAFKIGQRVSDLRIPETPRRERLCDTSMNGQLRLILASRGTLSFR